MITVYSAWYFAKEIFCWTVCVSLLCCWRQLANRWLVYWLVSDHAAVGRDLSASDRHSSAAARSRWVLRFSSLPQRFTKQPVITLTPRRLFFLNLFYKQNSMKRSCHWLTVWRVSKCPHRCGSSSHWSTRSSNRTVSTISQVNPDLNGFISKKRTENPLTSITRPTRIERLYLHPLDCVYTKTFFKPAENARCSSENTEMVLCWRYTCTFFPDLYGCRMSFLNIF